MYTLLETWTKRIISMYFLVLKIFPDTNWILSSRTAHRHGAYSRLLSGSKEDRIRESNWNQLRRWTVS